MKVIFGFFEAIFALIAGLFYYASAIFYGVGLAGSVVLFVMLPWDFLVWLFKADWRTTEFKAPLIGFGVAVVCGLVSAVLGKCYEVSSDAQEWCSIRK